MKIELKDYLHLYLGCEVKVKRKNDTEYHIGRSCEITKKSNHGDWVVIWFDDVITVTSQTWQISSSNSHWFFLSEDFVKPILRPLSDMTENEADEIWKILDWNYRIPIQHRAAELIREFNVISEEEGNAHWGYLLKILPSLLKYNFDLFGLIEAGLAIDKTKSNKTVG